MVETRLAPWGALALRLALGTMWVSHGLLKLLVYTPAGFVAYLQSVGLPTQVAVPVILAELVGGAAILAGFHGRWASLALSPILVGATLAHAPNGWVFSSPNGGWEFPVFLIAASAAHALLGDGRLAFRAWRPLAAQPA
ncbi:DoxX family protein [Caulobacter sp. 17J80-11]|uniref:DoxX family protein n=1 Tax=Caulobacter sp. 17J80-11 TaxID=2763502 RepID=UPI001653E2A4|nr:DoxX family protein [Caulobacter sp. 17J80-11]MBC6982261.1 DoxX family protein [Caulobacter sp. 17J80-11]